MPVHLDAGSRIHERFGRDRIIRGALSAPFSLACQVVGVDQILPALIDRPSWVGELLAFAASVVKAYGRAFIERGLAVIIFDSYAAPPLVSPELYRKLILPPTAEVVHYFRHSLGVKLVPYIVGGNTQPILEAMLETGTNNLLCDFSSDLEFYVGRLRAEPIILRANLDARFLNSLSVPEIQKKTRETLALGRGHPRFMLGTSILPYDTSPEKVRAIRDVLL
jgi:uroporphyrinogen decarboxylase